MKVRQPEMPYRKESFDEAGKFQGVGIPGQVALKKGGYTDNQKKDNRLPKNKPPRKFN